jgi:superfamily I DNA and/or RNA helicase
MDADSSQIAVIEDIKAGKNIVVEGPLGTGKSQTITNIIAELLVQGKSVLFVSEKMEALKVVKNRIDNAGLGDLCLEIHSEKTKKKEVLDELKRTLDKPAPKLVNIDQDINELQNLKKELNDYTSVLHEPVRKRGISLYGLYGLKEEVRLYFFKKSRLMPRAEFSDPDKWNNDQWNEANNTLEKLAEILPSIKIVSYNPWRGCEPGDLLPPELEKFDKLIDQLSQSITDLESSIKKLVNFTGNYTPSSECELIPLIEATKVVVSINQLDENILRNPEWNSPKREPEKLISELNKYQELNSIIQEKFQNSIFELDAAFFKSLSSSFFKFLNPKYKKMKREIQSCYNSRPPSDDTKILEDLNYLFDFKLANANLKKLESEGKKCFGNYWENEQTDPQLLKNLNKLIISLREYMLKYILSDKAFEIISRGSTKEDLNLTIKNTEKIKNNLIVQRNSLFELVNTDYVSVFKINFDEVTFEELKSRLNLWKSEKSSLVSWSQFINHKNQCLCTVAAPFIKLIDNDDILGEGLIYTFSGNYVDSLLKIIFREKKILPEFIKEIQDNKINKFKELDRKIISLNSQRVKAYCNKPNLDSEASRNSEAGILQTEFFRKRGHMPIRKLMTRAGGLIQKIKPCFMMSPLSIAQYLDPRTTKLPSQVKPEDAIGALLRGNQVVVIGDSCQLPPTNFFDHITEVLDSDPDDDDVGYKDMGSILNMCKGACFPSKSLLWHYRSKHESLITVSNREFYENRLYIYPSHMHDSENLGLKFVHLPNTIYDRGKSSINRGEAHAVAKAVLEHYNRFPSKSIGVGTFNTKQQQAILN